jgi:hypothetical protein
MKTASVEVRMTAEEKRGFQQAAELSGIALSAWIRERLRRAATRELEDAGKGVPFLRLRSE